MKKLLAILLTLTVLFTLVSCGEESGSSGKSGGWDSSAIEEYNKEAYAEITSGLPEPTTEITIHAISTASGLAFDFASEADAEAWKQTLISDGFEMTEEIFGMYVYENDAHRIQFSGVSIIVKIK